MSLCVDNEMNLCKRLFNNISKLQTSIKRPFTVDYSYVILLLLLLLISTNYQKRYKGIKIKLTTLHNNKRTIELLQGCVDYKYNTILASQMLLISQNNTLTRFL